MRVAGELERKKKIDRRAREKKKLTGELRDEGDERPVSLREKKTEEERRMKRSRREREREREKRKGLF